MFLLLASIVNNRNSGEHNNLLYFAGTLLSAPTVLCCATARLMSKWRALCLNVVSALLQTLTCLLIVGWIWSILWAMTFVQLSCKYGLRNNVVTKYVELECLWVGYSLPLAQTSVQTIEHGTTEFLLKP